MSAIVAPFWHLLWIINDFNFVSDQSFQDLTSSFFRTNFLTFHLVTGEALEEEDFDEEEEEDEEGEEGEEEEDDPDFDPAKAKPGQQECKQQ